MSFVSILFDRPEDRARVEAAEPPAFFGDLNLDQVVASVTAGRDEYDLKPFFYVPLRGVDSVVYRQEVLRDLERKDVSGPIRAFAERMRAMRQHLAQAEKLRHHYQKEAWTLDAAEIYGDAVRRLADDLAVVEIGSRGLLGLRDHLSSYVRSGPFASLVVETARRKEDLAGIEYALHIGGDRLTVYPYEGEADYATEVLRTFERFERGAAKDYRIGFRDGAEMDHVEAGVLERVALRFPAVFAALDEYCDRHRGYLDQTISDFDREVQLYLAYLEHVERLRAGGLSFCYPRVSDSSKQIRLSETFDVALAGQLVPKGSPVVSNDLSLTGPERIAVVSGPNNGGKTTCARTFGQLHYLASLGLLVPGKEAQVFLFDRLFTQFEREEQLGDLRGKLQDDLLRIRELLDQATPRSVVILNEIFTSTTFRDALFLSTKVMERIVELDLLCVWVTFVDELASMGDTTVSMVSTVRPDDPAVRTFRVVRRPADGRAYADAIAAKYGLSYERLRERLAT